MRDAPSFLVLTRKMMTDHGIFRLFCNPQGVWEDETLWHGRYASWPCHPHTICWVVPIKAVSGSTFQQKQHFWIVSQSWRVNSILVGQIQLFAGEIHDFCWLNSWCLLNSQFFWWVQSPSPHHPPSNWALLTLPWLVAPRRAAQQVLGQAWARPTNLSMAAFLASLVYQKQEIWGYSSSGYNDNSNRDVMMVETRWFIYQEAWCSWYHRVPNGLGYLVCLQ